METTITEQYVEQITSLLKTIDVLETIKNNAETLISNCYKNIQNIANCYKNTQDITDNIYYTT